MMTYVSDDILKQPVIINQTSIVFFIMKSDLQTMTPCCMVKWLVLSHGTEV